VEKRIAGPCLVAATPRLEVHMLDSIQYHMHATSMQVNRTEMHVFGSMMFFLCYICTCTTSGYVLAQFVFISFVFAFLLLITKILCG
jgi:hypothetical protein